MASDKFGNNPVAPLYNATGRNPRDLEMGSIGKPLGSVGNSGGGGKDFGTPGKPAAPGQLGGSYLSPFSTWGPNSMFQEIKNVSKGKGLTGRGGGTRRDPRLGGGGGYDDDDEDEGSGGGRTDADGREIDLEASLALTKAATPQTVNFAEQAGRNVVQNSQYSEDGDNYKDIQQKIETTPGASPAKPTRTPEQIQASKDKGQATRAANKAANPTAYGRKNPDRPERTQSPIARKPRAASAKPRATATQSVGKVTQTMGNF